MIIADRLRSAFSRVGGFLAGAGTFVGGTFATIAAFTATGPVIASLLVATPFVMASIAVVHYTSRGIEMAIDSYNEREQRQVRDNRMEVNQTAANDTAASVTTPDDVVHPETERRGTPPLRVRALGIPGPNPLLTPSARADLLSAEVSGSVEL